MSCRLPHMAILPMKLSSGSSIEMKHMTKAFWLLPLSAALLATAKLDGHTWNEAATEVALPYCLFAILVAIWKFCRFIRSLLP